MTSSEMKKVFKNALTAVLAILLTHCVYSHAHRAKEGSSWRVGGFSLLAYSHYLLFSC
jgi:hypothetical protein